MGIKDQDWILKEAQQYDKILRENMEAALPGIMENLLHLRYVHSEELPDSLQHTKERKPDVLKKVTDIDGDTFVLHIEFQAANDANMPFRMAEYWVMLMRIYRLPVKQYVIYIGEDRMTMASSLASGSNFFSYNIIDISAIDYRVFLRSGTVDEKMLAILANFGTENAEKALENIISGVLPEWLGPLEKERRKNQLRMLARLRNLAKLNIERMLANVSDLFSMEKDMLYIAGETKGRTEEKSAWVAKLLLQTDFSNERIAELAEVPVDFVTRIKSSLK